MITANESDLLILSLIIECSILTHVSMKIVRRDSLEVKYIERYRAHMCLLTHIHIHILSRQIELHCSAFYYKYDQKNTIKIGK